MKLIFKLSICIFFISLNNLYGVEFKGQFVQGSFILGIAEPGSKIYIDKKKVKITNDGYFVFGLDRDRKNNVLIKVTQNVNSKIIEKSIQEKIQNTKN